MQFLLDNIFTVITALLSGSMLFWSLFGNRIRNINEIDHHAAMQLINHKNALVLDVREEQEFKSGHILNAKWIPLGKLAERLGELEKYRERPILAVCRSGHRSGIACAILGKNGFAQAYNLGGGVTAWQKANLPLGK